MPDTTFTKADTTTDLNIAQRRLAQLDTFLDGESKETARTSIGMLTVERASDGFSLTLHPWNGPDTCAYSVSKSGEPTSSRATSANRKPSGIVDGVTIEPLSHTIDQVLDAAIQAKGGIREFFTLKDAASPAVDRSVLGLVGYRHFSDDSVQIQFPKGVSLEQFVEMAITEANLLGNDQRSSLKLGNLKALTKAESDLPEEYRIKDSMTYRFFIPRHSLGNSKFDQQQKYGAAAPLGIVAAAEVCEHLRTAGESTLFKVHGDRHGVMGAMVMTLRTSAPGLAINPSLGVYQYGDHLLDRDRRGRGGPAYAALLDPIAVK